MPSDETRKQSPISRQSADEKLTFYRLADKVRLIPGLPQPIEGTIGQLADYLQELCVSRSCEGEVWTAYRQAAWLIHEITVATPWERWLGPAGLRRVYNVKFFPDPALHTYLGLGKHVVAEIECNRCKDIFTIVVDDRYVWCDCKGAERQKIQLPDWPETLDAFAGRQKKLNRKIFRVSGSGGRDR